MTAGGFDRVAQGRRDIEKRWGKYRADRVARGLPPTRAEETGRKPTFLDVDSEPYWLDKVDRLGLTEGMNRTAARRLAKRFADDATTEEGRRFDADTTAVPPLGDDDLLVAFYEGEVTRWRARAERDRQIAADHDRQADEAQQALTTLLFKLGRIS